MCLDKNILILFILILIGFIPYVKKKKIKNEDKNLYFIFIYKYSVKKINKLIN